MPKTRQSAIVREHRGGIMKRREFFKKAGISSAALVSLPGFAGAKAGTPAGKENGRQDDHDQEHGHGHGDQDDDLSGPLANATVAFGQWNTEPAIDRFPNNSPRTANNHKLLPGETTIKVGGSVSFVISGFHHLLVYGNRTKPTDINLNSLVFPTVQLGPTPGPPLINDPANRIYRGLDPSVFPMLPGSTPPQPLQDRVEVVRFQNPGRFLVMCGVLPHFFDSVSGEFIMFGYVRVVR
jgi:hypothetical protein